MSLWNGILNSVSRSHKRSDGVIFFVGDRSCGKRHLISAISGKETKDQGAELGFTYFDALHPGELKDRRGDDVVARLNVWFQNDPKDIDLLKLPLENTDTRFEHSLVMIAVDSENIEDIENTLVSWTNVLKKQINKAISNLPLDVQDKIRISLTRYWQTYKEPSKEEEARGRFIAAAPENEVDYSSLPPLPSDVMSKNLGIPLIIVVTKSDHLSTYEKDKVKSTQWDFAQTYLRKFALQHGAALVYTSATSGKNVKELHEYAIHRLYPESYCFNHCAKVLEDPNGVFIPAGWDSVSLIESHIPSRGRWKNDTSFSSVIPPPATAAHHHASSLVDIRCEEDEVFLTDMRKVSEAASSYEKKREDKKKAQAKGDLQGKADSEQETKRFFSSLLINNSLSKSR